MIFALARAGVDVFRLNLAHGTPESHGRVVRWVREAGEELDKPIAILADLAGPKIRIGRLAEPVQLVEGSGVVLAPEDHAAPGELPTTFDALAR
ncbi:MAG TPA: pyruvate kinase, partial [Nannocystis sp.]